MVMEWQEKDNIHCIRNKKRVRSSSTSIIEIVSHVQLKWVKMKMCELVLCDRTDFQRLMISGGTVYNGI